MVSIIIAVSMLIILIGKDLSDIQVYALLWLAGIPLWIGIVGSPIAFAEIITIQSLVLWIATDFLRRTVEFKFGVQVAVFNRRLSYVAV